MMNMRTRTGTNQTSLSQNSRNPVSMMSQNALNIIQEHSSEHDGSNEVGANQTPFSQQNSSTMNTLTQFAKGLRQNNNARNTSSLIQYDDTRSENRQVSFVSLIPQLYPNNDTKKNSRTAAQEPSEPQVEQSNPAPRAQKAQSHIKDVIDVLKHAMHSDERGLNDQDELDESADNEPLPQDVFDLRAFLRANELSFRARIIYELHYACEKDVFIPSYRTVRALVVWLSVLCQPWDEAKYGNLCFIEVGAGKTIERAFKPQMLDKYMGRGDLTDHYKVKELLPEANKEQVFQALETAMSLLMLPLSDLVKLKETQVVENCEIVYTLCCAWSDQLAQAIGENLQDRDTRYKSDRHHVEWNEAHEAWMLWTYCTGTEPRIEPSSNSLKNLDLETEERMQPLDRNLTAPSEQFTASIEQETSFMPIIPVKITAKAARKVYGLTVKLAHESSDSQEEKKVEPLAEEPQLQQTVETKANTEKAGDDDVVMKSGTGDPAQPSGTELKKPNNKHSQSSSKSSKSRTNSSARKKSAKRSTRNKKDSGDESVDSQQLEQEAREQSQEEKDAAAKKAKIKADKKAKRQAAAATTAATEQTQANADDKPATNLVDSEQKPPASSGADGSSAAASSAPSEPKGPGLSGGSAPSESKAPGSSGGSAPSEPKGPGLSGGSAPSESKAPGSSGTSSVFASHQLKPTINVAKEVALAQGQFQSQQHQSIQFDQDTEELCMMIPIEKFLQHTEHVCITKSLLMGYDPSSVVEEVYVPVLMNPIFYENNKVQLRQWIVDYRTESWFDKFKPLNLSPAQLERVLYVPLLSVMNGLHTRDLFYKYLSEVDNNLAKQVYGGESRLKDLAGVCPEAPAFPLYKVGVRELQEQNPQRQAFRVLPKALHNNSLGRQAMGCIVEQGFNSIVHYDKTAEFVKEKWFSSGPSYTKLGEIQTQALTAGILKSKFKAIANQCAYDMMTQSKDVDYGTLEKNLVEPLYKNTDDAQLDVWEEGQAEIIAPRCVPALMYKTEFPSNLKKQPTKTKLLPVHPIHTFNAHYGQLACATQYDYLCCNMHEVHAGLHQSILQLIIDGQHKAPLLGNYKKKNITRNTKGNVVAADENGVLFMSGFLCAGVWDCSTLDRIGNDSVLFNEFLSHTAKQVNVMLRVVYFPLRSHADTAFKQRYACSKLFAAKLHQNAKLNLMQWHISIDGGEFKPTQDEPVIDGNGFSKDSMQSPLLHEVLYGACSLEVYVPQRKEPTTYSNRFGMQKVDAYVAEGMPPPVVSAQNNVDDMMSRDNKLKRYILHAMQPINFLSKVDPFRTSNKDQKYFTYEVTRDHLAKGTCISTYLFKDKVSLNAWAEKENNKIQMQGLTSKISAPSSGRTTTRKQAELSKQNLKNTSQERSLASLQAKANNQANLLSKRQSQDPMQVRSAVFSQDTSAARKEHVQNEAKVQFSGQVPDAVTSKADLDFNYFWEDHIVEGSNYVPSSLLTPKLFSTKNEYFKLIQKRDFSEFLTRTKQLLRQLLHEGPTPEITAELEEMDKICHAYYPSQKHQLQLLKHLQSVTLMEAQCVKNMSIEALEKFIEIKKAEAWADRIIREGGGTEQLGQQLDQARGRFLQDLPQGFTSKYMNRGHFKDLTTVMHTMENTKYEKNKREEAFKRLTDYVNKINLMEDFNAQQQKVSSQRKSPQQSQATAARNSEQTQATMVPEQVQQTSFVPGFSQQYQQHNKPHHQSQANVVQGTVVQPPSSSSAQSLSQSQPYFQAQQQQQLSPYQQQLWNELFKGWTPTTPPPAGNTTTANTQPAYLNQSQPGVSTSTPQAQIFPQFQFQPQYPQFQPQQPQHYPPLYNQFAQPVFQPPQFLPQTTTMTQFQNQPNQVQQGPDRPNNTTETTGAAAPAHPNLSTSHNTPMFDMTGGTNCGYFGAPAGSGPFSDRLPENKQ